MQNRSYATDLTNAQWALLEPMLPARKKRGRPPTDVRRAFNAILYVLKGGIPWRLLPSDFPPCKTVFGIFRRWCQEGVWQALNDRLRAHVREQEGKRCRPTGAILDSQSVKSDPHGGEVGYDAAKKIKGRKRHLLVDTLGLVLGVVLTPASTPEREGGRTLLEGVLDGFGWRRLLWVDGGYSGDGFEGSVRELRPGLEVVVVKRSDDASGFKVLPRRWVVERTFGWLMRQRRLARDYETTETSAASWIYTAMIRIMLRRLA
jgi:putative transposase